MDEKEKRTKILVALPNGLVDKLNHLARRNNRSRNGEIITLLERAVEDTEKENGETSTEYSDLCRKVANG